MAEEKFSEVEVEALQELMEVAVAMKKSGLLGMMKELLADTEAGFHAILSDPVLIRYLALIGAALEAGRRLDPAKIPQAKKTVEDATYCALEGLASIDPAKVEGKGLFGLLGALRDPQVQKGLGLLIALAKAMGACLEKQAAKA